MSFQLCLWLFCSKHLLYEIFVERSKALCLNVVEFANSVDRDKAAQNEPPNLDLLCLPSNHGTV